MGIGAGIAGGCNIGHGITGLSTLSLGSLLATVTTMGGVWAATGVIFFQGKAKGDVVVLNNQQQEGGKHAVLYRQIHKNYGVIHYRKYFYVRSNICGWKW